MRPSPSGAAAKHRDTLGAAALGWDAAEMQFIENRKERWPFGHTANLFQPSSDRP
jgi:hypothetical protein